MSLVVVAQAQTTTTAPTTTAEADTTKTDQIVVDFSDVFEYITEGDSVIQRLVGDVELRQDSVYMYNDSTKAWSTINYNVQNHKYGIDLWPKEFSGGYLYATGDSIRRVPFAKNGTTIISKNFFSKISII